MNDQPQVAAPATNPSQVLAWQRSAALGAIAQTALHEYRNLMTPLVARAEAALAMPGEDFARRALEACRSQAQAAIDLCERLLSIADVPAQGRAACGLRSTIEKALGLFARPFQKDAIDVRISVGEAVRVQSEPLLLRQLIFTILLMFRVRLDRGAAVELLAHQSDEVLQLDVRAGPLRSALPPAQALNGFLAQPFGDDPTDARGLGLDCIAIRVLSQLLGATVGMDAEKPAESTLHVRWVT